MSEKALKRYLKRRDKKERGQLSSRQHLGLLEKKKDYRLRVQNFNKKRDHLRHLQRKTEFRNPDEFYKKMDQTKVDSNGNIITTQQKFRATQKMEQDKEVDHRFLQQKIQRLRKEVDRDRDSLSTLSSFDKDKSRTHGIFVDDEEKADKWSAEKHFNTLSQLVSRSHNRLTCEQLEGDVILNKITPGLLQEVDQAQGTAYSEVREKEKVLHSMKKTQKILEQQRNLMKGGRFRKIVKKDKFGDEIKSKTMYKWKNERKK